MHTRSGVSNTCSSAATPGIIPERLAYVTFYTGDMIPTDMYYERPHGSWNADGGLALGEQVPFATDLAMTAILHAEALSEGSPRLPPRTRLSSSTRRSITRRLALDTTYKSDFLLLGQDIPF